MNLRVETAEKDQCTKYWYFFSYAFQTNTGIGEGMCELCFKGRKIKNIADLQEVADYLKEDNNKKTNAKYFKNWSSVVIRNFILMREENTDGTEQREEESSSENDIEVSEGS